MLAVSDTGVGMDKQTLARIFEPFFTTKEKGKGTGLGLSTAFGIVKQSAGSIWVYSEPGNGATFKVYLPATQDAPDSLPVPAPALAVRGSETVLLVEDEDQVRALAAGILRRYGYRVLEAPTAREAIALAGTQPGRLDLLLTDVVMPEMGGPLLAKKLRALRPDLRVLFMSGYTDDAVVRHGLLEAGAAFLQKPFVPEALARRVRDALDE
jgi:CheY-like chemotaxis protein